MLFLLMVAENQMPGGVFTASIIPPHGFLPLGGVGWRNVEPRCPIGVIISFKGGLRFRRFLGCASFAALSPHLAGLSDGEPQRAA